MLRSAAVVLLLAVLTYSGARWYKYMGYHLHYYNSRPAHCHVVDNAGLGSEDLQVTTDGLAFITSGCTFSQNPPNFDIYMEEKGIKGRIFLYNFNEPKKGAIELNIKTSDTFSLDDFRAHGISILEDANGEHLLYVVNHPFPKPDSIEKFQFKPASNELVHLKTFTSEALRTANDLAIVEEDKFYITNFIYSKEDIWVRIEGMFKMPWCNILYFNGTEFSEVVSNLNGPNGVVLSKDRKFVYVAFPHYLEIFVFKVTEDMRLVQVQTAHVHTLPDNLNLSKDGTTIYVGAHPIPYKIIEFINDPWTQAPSQVLSFPLVNGLIEVENGKQLFYDDGRLIKASTVADVYKDTLMIGSLLDTLVVCENNTPS